ncbi:LEAF RUST 10 DISEASE-RESISTANCE LOCUS RECEPTOR-LIKE PROTEIN KINASE-like 2.1 [Corylus avellana]|uniref:LEAF RUST 10 DISEASE-RESISTANCE LOCUS RECEPTOR-LIKE PROTEIN KINASE-like 2.1 n=1 Tax=Corylus avellana TaxID=13451 RepID=UPI00286B2A9F|nr:LEAF RUST 10 DISEASE-RESISTANCE LOCUS RECEPTOR-LIKE PROTEIN KINASE-like 2.1 [Corylus avellana]
MMIEEDQYVYVKRSKGSFIILSLYVDDILLVGNDKDMIVASKGWLSSNFEMKDMGEADYIPGVKIFRDQSKKLLSLSQQTYIKKVLERFQMYDCKPIAKGENLCLEMCLKTQDEIEKMTRVPYANAIGSLMYAMMCAQQDICDAVGLVSRFQSNPEQTHWKAVKRILRYLKGTANYVLCYQGSNLCLVGYSDADWGSDLDERKSTSGYAFLVNNGAITWNSKKQSYIALSTMKAKYVAFTLSIGIGVLMVTICYFKKKFSSSKLICFWKKESQTHKSVEAFLRNNKPLAIRRYSYSYIKKMTNFFRNILGEGDFGGVYKGKLQDGSLVAVKVLKESKGNGEEFINEVASIGRTSHVNIVTLMGFCFEGTKRTLIYEFMPDGSLEKFIYKENRSKANCHLEWETIYKIALGIACGLEYLHRGCNTRILHFDIKPHNILLDENFCPKISDFGLAKICSREESIISMLGERGTIGYVAPELVCRNIGVVSHKSDVYSYGMMVSEMVGGRKNIDIGVDRSSELFFPHWIYKHLELDEELGLEGLMNEDDQERARKMVTVNLRCIQTDPSNRSPMSKVVNMLEGSLDSIQIPPKYRLLIKHSFAFTFILKI